MDIQAGRAEPKLFGCDHANGVNSDKTCAIIFVRQRYLFYLIFFIPFTPHQLLSCLYYMSVLSNLCARPLQETIYASNNYESPSVVNRSSQPLTLLVYASFAQDCACPFAGRTCLQSASAARKLFACSLSAALLWSDLEIFITHKVLSTRRV